MLCYSSAVKRNEARVSAKNFKRVRVSELRQGRKGKHHDAVMPIVDEIESLSDGEAIVIPLASLRIPLTNLRAALTKAAAARELKVSTYSDENSLYVWRKTPGSRPYERASRRAVKAN